MKKLVISVTICFCIVFSLSACGASNSDVKKYTVDFIDALIVNDCSGAYALMVSEVDYQSFEKAFDDIYSLVDGVSEYDLKQTSFYTGISNGLYYTQVTYLMTTEIGDFQIITTMCRGYEGIYNFHLAEIEE